MKIKFLGTAAAEGIPASFCNCPVCKKAYEEGGKNIRTRLQTLINDDLLIDFPQDSYMHKLQYNLDLSAIKYLLVTHNHMDHFYPQEFTVRGSYYSHEMVSPILTIACAEETKDLFYRVNIGEMEKESDELIQWEIVKPYISYSLGEYQVIPIKARHMAGWPDNNPYFFIVKDREHEILYAHDTAVFYEEVWEFLEAYKGKFDLVSLDCTHVKSGKGTNGVHMGIPDDVFIKNKLISLEKTKENTIWVLNHFSHNDAILHREIEELVEDDGFVVAYDGMEITL